MATKLRRSLYIGLGGTGMKALLHTKKMFIDTYGEVPPMIGFIGIDTDKGEYNNRVTSARGEEVKLDPNEQLQLAATGAVDFYYNHRPDFTWIPQTNVNAIAMLRGEGAGGVRSNGRIAFTINKTRIEGTIRDKVNNITNAAIMENDKYTLLADTLPEIHLVFSICGGTGCGTFINMSYLLKEINRAFKVTGYAVLPGAFENLPASAHVMPNTYGALYDLDYLMHHGIENNPIDIKYLNNSSYSAKERPFTNVFFIDNRNAKFDNYGNVESVTEMISLALITAAGELSVAGASVGDNFSVIISMGTLDIENKKAWAGGMGACEIVYHGKDLAEIYRMKAAINIIARLNSSTADVNIIANSWIDSAEIRIRENNGSDDLTDHLGSKTPRFNLTINNTSRPEDDYNPNKLSNELDKEELEQKVQSKLETARAGLRDLIINHINRDGGIATAKGILSELDSQMSICRKEMTEEKLELVEKIATLNTQIENIAKQLKAVTGLFSGGKKRELSQQLERRVYEYNEAVRDMQRHDAAITFYTSFITTISEMNSRIESIDNLLRNVENNLVTKVNTLQNNAERESSIFQINLATEDAKRVTLNEAEIVISDMISQFENDFKIFGFNDYTSREVEELLMKYTATLNGANTYMNRGVEETLKNLQQSDPEILRRIIEMASRKSQPLFTYNHRGHQPRQNMIDMIYVGVYNKDNSILQQDNLFKNSLPPADGLSVTRNVAFASTGMKDKVIIYNQVGVVPVYALTNIDNYQIQYNSTYLGNSSGHHFDDDMLTRSVHEEFSIQPKKTYDANNLIDIWVKGFIYGLIKNENGKYQMRCKSLGRALDGYWISLGSAYRNEAFEEFKRKETSFLNEFNQHFANEDQRMGAEATSILRDDVKMNYLEKFSQINLDRRTLDGHGYEKVRELIEQELRHIEENI